MFKKLTLTNFRSVDSATLDLTQGLQVLRGRSEAGKSTRLEAIAYALFGTSALRTSLEGAVTYGKAVSSLKVALEFAVDGVLYTVTRGKSGAEIVYAGGTVTGQTETKLFVERLLGISAAMSTKLLFANQSDVKGILSQGGTAASALIETLADLGQIEVFIEKIQAQLPCGNTAALTGQLEALEESLKAELPVEPDGAAVALAKYEMEGIADALVQTTASTESIRQSAKEARVELAKIDEIEAENARTERRRVSLSAVAAPTAPTKSREDLAALIKAEGDMDGAWALYKASKLVFAKPAKMFEGTRAEFFEEVEKLKTFGAALRDKQSALKVQIASAQALLINETTCGFCKKDLSSVPEVVSANAAAHDKLQALSAQLNTVEVDLIEARALGKLYDAWLADDRKTMAALGKFWEPSDTMPCVPVWAHGEVAEPESKADEVKSLKTAFAVYDRELYEFESAQKGLTELKVLPVPVRDRFTLTLEAVKLAEELLAGEVQRLNDAKVVYAQAQGSHEAELARYNAEVSRAERDRAMAAKLKDEIAQMGRVNELVKKLRTARPIIASKLWDTVLGAVSYYFSQVRGVTSTVSRTVKGFEVDGQELDGLSGSTQDALGLALRLALVKTFIPNASFLSLDEPASGCDEARELAMLGVIAASGFEQVLLVTHSDLADSFAANVVAV